MVRRRSSRSEVLPREPFGRDLEEKSSPDLVEEEKNISKEKRDGRENREGKPERIYPAGGRTLQKEDESN